MDDKYAHEHRLVLAEVLEMMVADGLIDVAVADALKSERRLHGGRIHPLVVIADQKWRSLKAPARLLSLEILTEWLAAHCGLNYLHIDPLKIDFTGVAEIMSSAYAARFGILPVQVTTREIVIATAEPFVREWVDELKPILRKEIRRVMAPGGRLFILINLYSDNEYSLQWVDKLKVRVHVRSAAEYVAMLREHGFDNAEWRQIPDPNQTQFELPERKEFPRPVGQTDQALPFAWRHRPGPSVCPFETGACDGLPIDQPIALEPFQNFVL